VYFTGVTWNNVYIIAANYLAMGIVYGLVLHRETIKQRMGEEWKPDWIDRLNGLGARLYAGLIRGKRIPVFDGARHHTRRAHSEVSIENKEGLGAVEDNIS
ncbi:MAG: hypothetical protein KAS16_05620, partial [Thermoplasmata archaeon]|nr:hypothetical protein [Thermoplasmata archaeon]